MDLYLLMIIVFSFIGIKFFFKGFNVDYLSKKNTSCIKGFFILIVFYSHFLSYVGPLYYNDFFILNFRNFLGQLMVTLFLFYSGYGVFESIKNKKNYINLIPKNRIFKTLFNFFIAVLMFLFLNLLLKKSYSFFHIVLSFIGWESLGNSNWYIFSIAFMYFITYFSFKIFDKNYRNALVLNLLLIILFILFLNLYKGEYWYDTIFCYYFGMLFSYKKTNIEKILFDNKKYLMILFISFLSFLVLNKYSAINFIYYELYSVCFVVLVILLSLKISINSIFLKFFGDNLFWIYILQRLPMIYFNSIGFSRYYCKYFIVCFGCTLVLTFIFIKISKFFGHYFFKKN